MVEKRAKNNTFSFEILTKEQSKDTGMALVLIFILLGLFQKNENYFYFGLLSLIINMIWPIFYKPMAWLWFGFAKVMGSVMSKIILSIIFFIIVTPIALLRKILGKDSLQLKKWKSDTSSVFTTRNIKFNAKNIEKPY